MKFQINKIYNEDCVVGMRNMPNHSIDNILTSPPYNTSRNSGSFENLDRRYDVYTEFESNEEYCKWTVELFNMYDKVLKKNGCVLYNISYGVDGVENVECMPLAVAEIIKSTPFTIADIIVWKKNNAIPNNSSSNKLTRICEFVYVFCRKQEFNTFYCNKKVLSVSSKGQNVYENIFNKVTAKNNDGKNPYNNATFSTEFVERLIDMYIKPHSLVLDCFMGTGTTAIGCINRNVNFVGFEISKKQCEYAEKRIRRRLQQQSLFDEIDYLEEKFIETNS